MCLCWPHGMVSRSLFAKPPLVMFTAHIPGDGPDSFFILWSILKNINQSGQSPCTWRVHRKRGYIWLWTRVSDPTSLRAWSCSHWKLMEIFPLISMGLELGPKREELAVVQRQRKIASGTFSRTVKFIPCWLLLARQSQSILIPTFPLLAGTASASAVLQTVGQCLPNSGISFIYEFMAYSNVECLNSRQAKFCLD